MNKSPCFPSRTRSGTRAGTQAAPHQADRGSHRQHPLLRLAKARFSKQILAGTALATVPLAALADVAVPVSANYLGSLWLAIPLLIPVIAIEALILWAMLGKRLGQSIWWSLRQMAWINLVTSLVGTAFLLVLEVYSPEPLFFVQFLLTIGLEFLLLLRPTRIERSLGKVTRTQLFGLSGLMNLPSYALLFVLLWFNYAGPSRNPNLRSQMEKLQTMVETYAVDWGGLYPDSLEQLRAEATRRQYWNEPRLPSQTRFFRDPYQRDSMLLFSGDSPRPYGIAYRPLYRAPGTRPTANLAEQAGQGAKNGPACGYEISGYGYDGKLLTVNGTPKVLRAGCE